jgi:hypothetical protein
MDKNKLFQLYQSGSLNNAEGLSQVDRDIVQTAIDAGTGLDTKQFGTIAEHVGKFNDQFTAGTMTPELYKGMLEDIPVIVNMTWNRPMNRVKRDGKPLERRKEAEPPAPTMAPIAVRHSSTVGTQIPVRMPMLNRKDTATATAPLKPDAINIAGPTPPVQSALSRVAPPVPNEAARAALMTSQNRLRRDHREASNQQASNTNATQQKPTSKASRIMDYLQMGLDAIGVLDPTGIADASNGILSLGRAAIEPERAGHHLVNAGVSAMSIIPYVGDTSKLGKYGFRAAKTSKSEKMAAMASSVHRHQAPTPAMSSGNGNGNNLPPRSYGDGYMDGDEGFLSGDAATGMKNLGNTVQRGLAKTGSFGELMIKAVEGLEKFVEWLGKVDDRNKVILNSFEHLTKFNGAIAASYERLEIDRNQRAIGKGRYMANAVGNLADAQSAFEQSKQNITGPYERFATNMQTGMTKLGDAATRVIDRIDYVGDALDGVNKLLEKWMGEDKKDDKPMLNRAMDMFDKQLKDDWNL